MSVLTTKVSTVYPITRWIPMPAIATTGRAQKGCSILATSSPIATAMVVAGMDAFSATAAGMVKGPCTAQCPPPLGMMNEMKIDDTKLRTGSVAAEAEAAIEDDMICASPLALILPIITPSL